MTKQEWNHIYRAVQQTKEQVRAMELYLDEILRAQGDEWQPEPKPYVPKLDPSAEAHQ